jgi:hypothetical protein
MLSTFRKSAAKLLLEKVQQKPSFKKSAAKTLF